MVNVKKKIPPGLRSQKWVNKFLHMMDIQNLLNMDKTKKASPDRRGLRERLQSSMLFKKGNSLQRGAGESESDFILFATSE